MHTYLGVRNCSQDAARLPVIPFLRVYLVFIVRVMRFHSMSAIPLTQVPVSVSFTASVILSVMCACLVSAILVVICFGM